MSHKLGIQDEDFIRGATPMTKEEIRVLSLSKAKIGEADFVLDIGAGTGSLSIESALLAERGQVYAIERNSEGVSLIKQNAAKFNVKNITVIEGEAPDALVDLPQFDVILIGGSGKKLRQIMDKCEMLLKPGGRLVINCVTVETLAESLSMLADKPHFTYDAIQAQITHLSKLSTYHMFKALNPIYIIACTKQAL